MDKNNSKVVYINQEKNIAAESREIAGKLAQLSGSNALNMVLDHDNPLALVQNMTKIDLFWLIKKVGEDDAQPLLALASTEQWQYIMDMETWDRDRINKAVTFKWYNLLLKSDPDRLVEHMYSEDGNLLTHLFFSGILDIRAKEDDDFVLPEGFITFDNLFYIGIGDKENTEEIEQLLRNLALYDHNRFQALLLGLQGTIPAEIEEECYRLKSIRLAEEGYLPFEEAVSVYAYQNTDQLKKDSSDYILNVPDNEDSGSIIPVTPFLTAQEDNLFAMAVTGIDDSLILDRLRLELAGLCNQIFSADGAVFESVDDLVKICKKAGGYINTGLEKLSGGDIATAIDFLRHHPLITIFRAGFSQALELRWKAERWIKKSWFDRMDFSNDFWGDEWGGILDGILFTKPLLFSEKEDKTTYRDFVSLEDVREIDTVLDRIAVIDKLLETVIADSDIESLDETDDFTFYQILFTFWIGRVCGLSDGLRVLNVDEAKSALEKLRKGETAPPYKMAENKDEFIKGLSFLILESEEIDRSITEETLSIIWDAFTDEYEMISTDDLEPRYSRFILIGA